MSASKEFYESIGYSEKMKLERPILEVGIRFTVTDSYYKSDLGTWEIIKNDDAPVYSCIRVLKNGTLSKSWSNKRALSETTIYRALDKQ